MELFRSIRISQARTPEDVYDAICRLKPEGRRYDGFFLEAAPGDQEAGALLDQIVAVCKQHGLKPTQGDNLGSYVHLIKPVYNEDDLSDAPMLWLKTQRKTFHNVERDMEGRLVLKRAQIKPGVLLASVYPRPWIIVADPIRQSLLEAGLRGLAFCEVLSEGRPKSSSNALPLWELTSPIILPKMSNSVPREDDPLREHRINDPLAEPHYSSSELDRVGPFDLGRTFERLQTGEPWLIVSHRFYEHCTHNRIPLEASPVRVDFPA